MRKRKLILNCVVKYSPYLNNKGQEDILKDIEKLIEGRINYSVSQRFFFKWSNINDKAWKMTRTRGILKK